jgi:uncharacterized membrane protein
MPTNSLLVFFVFVMFFGVILQIHIIEVAFVKLGLTAESASAILLGTLLGSVINLPIYSIPSKENDHFVISAGRKLAWEVFQPVRKGRVVIAINIGGCLIPVGLCIYFILSQELDPFNIVISTLAITFLCYKFSRLIPGLGVCMPVFLAPLTAALLALVIDPEHAASLAYISGVLGVLIGADICRLNEITSLGAPIAAIGGAGTFDGIFITGIIAALLA